MLHNSVGALTDADAEAIATWRYPGRYATYDVAEVVDASRGFWAVEADGELIGYCCFGVEARVPGAVAEPGTLDVGYGMRPDLVGRGRGRGFVAAVLDFAAREFEPQRMRLLILDWNERSRRVAIAHGFEQTDVLQSKEGEFLVMMRQ